jgi:hypothetical protein
MKASATKTNPGKGKKKTPHKNEKLQPQKAASRMQLELAGSWNNSLKTSRQQCNLENFNGSDEGYCFELCKTNSSLPDQLLCYTMLYNAGAIIETKKPISYNKIEILIGMGVGKQSKNK